ncbi:hypothetical protein Tco_0831761 [Tanacetum coccineum]
MQMQESKVVSSKAVDASLVVTECRRTKSDEHITSSSSGTYITQVVDADIRPVNDQVPSAEVHLTAPHNVLANEQQHIDQSEPSYDTYLLEKGDSNTTPDSTNMSHRGGEIDQDAEQDQVKSPLLKAEFLKTNDMQQSKTSRSFPVPTKSRCGMSNGVRSSSSRNSSSFSDSKHFICSTCQKCVFDANHDDCITKFLKKVNSHAKVQSFKTRNINKPVEPKSHTQKPGRQIALGQRFSLNKSSAVREKLNTPRSCLRWILTGRIFKTASLRWIPTGKMFTDSTTKVDSEPPNGLKEDITNPYECKQSLDMALVQLSTGPDPTFLTPGQISSGLVPNTVPAAPYVPPTNKDLDILFQPMFDEYLEPPRVKRPVSPAPRSVHSSSQLNPETPSSTTIDKMHF